MTPFLEQVTGAGTITVLLLVYGAAGVIGNFVAGSWVARYPVLTFGTSAALLASATLLFPLVGTTQGAPPGF